jgi:hypothetical protein
MVLYRKYFFELIPIIPTNIGTNARSTGINLAKTIALGPYLSMIA